MDNSWRIGCAFCCVVAAFVLGGCSNDAGYSDRDDVAPGDVVVTSPTLAAEAPEDDDAPSEAEVMEALQEARRFFTDQGTRLFKFAHLLNVSREKFPQVVASIPGEPTPWQKVVLNTHGAKFDAIMFSSNLKTNGNLIWSYAVSPDTAIDGWSIAPSKWPMHGFSSYRKLRDLAAPELPERNLVVLQQLHHFDIQPKRPYYLPFLFSDDKPVELYVKLKVVPRTGQAIPDRPRELAQQLDFQLPFQFTSVAQLFPENAE